MTSRQAPQIPAGHSRMPCYSSISSYDEMEEDFVVLGDDALVRLVFTCSDSCGCDPELPSMPVFMKNYVILLCVLGVLPFAMNQSCISTYTMLKANIRVSRRAIKLNTSHRLRSNL